MIQGQYVVNTITASDGYTLTQAEDVNVESRVLSKKIYLAVNDHVDNWKEITDAEADEIRNEQERLAKEAQAEQEQ